MGSAQELTWTEVNEINAGRSNDQQAEDADNGSPSLVASQGLYPNSLVFGIKILSYCRAFVASTVFGQTMLLPPNFTLGLRRVSTHCHDDNPH